jgi:predicted molibdopterin-dependent oxidoreductase YjgC
MLEAARDGKLETLISIGGNFLEVLPDPDDVQRSLEAVPLRVHFDICLSSQMLLDGQEVILLPAMTRYEVPGGVTETSTERRIILSPEIPGPRVKEARPEFEVMLELARRVRPEIAARLEFAGMPAMRAEIARVVPSYAGIERLALGGDSVQYGGPHLCANGRFPLPDERARFARVSVSDASIPDGLFRVSTRRGKQFNSMVHALTDALNGAEREAVLIASEDASRLGLLDGDTVKLVSDHGEYVGCARIAAVKPGNLQVHWPEGNVLLDPRKRSRESHVPDYNAFVRLEKNVSGRASLSAAD